MKTPAQKLKDRNYMKNLIECHVKFWEDRIRNEGLEGAALDNANDLIRLHRRNLQKLEQEFHVEQGEMWGMEQA